MSERMLCTGYAKINETVNINDSLRLNDNMPSIKKLLYADTKAVITEIDTQNGTINIKGDAYIQIYYEGENNKPEAVSGNSPFNYLIECAADSNVALLNINNTHYEIDTSKQRRFDVSLKLNISGYALQQSELPDTTTLPQGISYIQKNIQENSSKVKSIFCEKTYEYEIDCEECVPYKIVAANCCISEDNISASKGGIMYSGSLNAQVMCISENDDGGYSYNCFTDNFAVNEFINTGVNDVYQDFSLSRNINIEEASISFGENNCSIMLKIKAIYRLDLIENICTDITEDIYSIDKKLELTKEEKILTQISTNKEIIHIKDSPKINFPSQINKALCPAWNIKITHQNEEEMKGELNITILILHSPDGKYSVQKTVIPFVKKCKAGIKNSFENTYLKNLSVDTVSDRLMIEADIIIDEMHLNENKAWKISEVNIKEYDECDDNFTKIKIHYFGKNESLWDIAKQNRTTVEKIMNINEISDETQIPLRYPLIIR